MRRWESGGSGVVSNFDWSAGPRRAFPAIVFDRHTLSLKDGHLSMYTLDGRMRFQVALAPGDETSFHEKKLREIVLSRSAAESFELAFLFSDGTEEEAIAPAAEAAAQLPQYMVVEESHAGANP